MHIYALNSYIESLARKNIRREDAKEEIRKLLNLFTNCSWLSINPPEVAQVFVAVSKIHDLLPTCNVGRSFYQLYELRNQIESFLRHIAANYVNEPVSSSFLRNQGLRIDEYVDLFQREVYNCRKGIAVNFYEKHLRPEEKHRVAETNGIDFRFPLCEKTTAQYKELYQWCNSEIDSKGNAHVMVGYYWSIDTATAPTALGISEVCTLHKSLSKKKKEVGHAMRSLIRLNCNAIHSEVLESTASEAIDIWSIPGAKIQTRGGGTQVFLPLPLETRRRLLEEEKIVEIEIAE